MVEKIKPEYDELIKHLRGIRKIVINSCYGGFGLSREAILKYLELSGIEYTFEPQQDRDTQNRLGSKIMVNGKQFVDHTIPRDDPVLVSVVKQLADKANDIHAELKVVEIPADVKWQIDEEDGNEWVAECHRTWS